MTLNRSDFKRLHQRNSDHSGIIICKEDSDRERQAQKIDEAVSKFEDLKGQLIRIYRPDK